MELDQLRPRTGASGSSECKTDFDYCAGAQPMSMIRLAAPLVMNCGFKRWLRVFVLCALAGLVFLSNVKIVAAEEVDPFAVLRGKWKGSGTMTMRDGSRYRLSSGRQSCHLLQQDPYRPGPARRGR